jgi:cell shape-determining protein MreC
MTYHFVRREHTSKKKLLVWFATVLVLTAFFWPSIRPFVYSHTEPIHHRVFSILHESQVIPDFVYTFFVSRAQLMEQQKNLENKIMDLENDLTYFRLNETTHASSSTSASKVIVMSSLVKDITNLYGTIIFNKGFEDGVMTDVNVYLAGRGIVCKIKEVYKNSSTCALFSAYGNSVEGITSSSSIPLRLEGRGGHYLANVLRDIQVEVGETVLSRDDQTFIVGTIAEVVRNNQDTFMRILVRPSHNPAIDSRFFVESK